ncbi:cobalt-precorrin-6A reductase [Haloechinothrix sp. LS1_15]|uniref:cobalt-precorrin-6A reductase n=1 Tax=Haloechinothrix sp. LS1_15 TaxID=2652248 RepID=UPI00294A9C3B|nr:cobalt-precorrin-6A reductase [Haloechinothrix sp. LS1_15]
MDYPLLLLGGTAEARTLAAELTDRGVRVISSLAGRVDRPRLPAGEVRIGGFGGAEGLAAWLREQRVRAVVDATHPFAERISAAAVAASRQAGVELLRLERPGWDRTDSEQWRWVSSLDEAAQLAGQLGERVFLTTGRQGLAAFADNREQWFLIRCVEQPDPPLPERCSIVLSRGPYTVEGERELMREYGIEVLITKDSGGSMTAAKLEAAQQLGVTVLAVRRPHRADVPTVTEVSDAVAWVLTRWDTTA